MNRVVIHPEVAAALEAGRPVVALETAVITHGLPKSPLHRALKSQPPHWDATMPTDLALAHALDAAVRSDDATPAFIAILKGNLHIGLDAEQWRTLAGDPDARKAASRDVAGIMATKASAGATVSATLAACGLNPHRPIRVMATGGIGGVHRHWRLRPDVSADLLQIASTPACVVCSGPKSLLDLPATVEAIESLAIPLLGFQTDHLPQFLSQGTDEFPVSQRVDSLDQAADICGLHWRTTASKSGVILANPPPDRLAMSHEEMIRLIESAEAEAEQASIHGPKRTPFVLGRMAEISEGRSVEANIALLIENARLAAGLAGRLAERDRADSSTPG